MLSNIIREVKWQKCQAQNEKRLREFMHDLLQKENEDFLTKVVVVFHFRVQHNEIDVGVDPSYKGIRNYYSKCSLTR